MMMIQHVEATPATRYLSSFMNMLENQILNIQYIHYNF